MSVGGVFEAYGKPLTTLGYEDLKDDPLIDATTIGLKGSPTNIFKSFTPPQKGAGMMLEGADKATCEKLVGDPDRQAHHLRKGIEELCLISTVLISLLSRMYGCSVSSVRAS